MAFFATRMGYLEGRVSPFEAPQGSKRTYPGEGEATYILNYIEFAAPRKRKAFLKRLSNMQVYEQRLKQTPPRAVRHVLPPEPTETMAQLAASILLDQRRLARFRRCLHCGTWFYARFRSQKFCGDQKKKCQWKHYHSPAWRRQNRPRNRKFQKEYRDRIYVRKRR
jgi:hypothetical protein